jgi:hypothetical protein
LLSCGGLIGRLPSVKAFLGIAEYALVVIMDSRLISDGVGL